MRLFTKIGLVVVSAIVLAIFALITHEAYVPGQTRRYLAESLIFSRWPTIACRTFVGMQL